MPNWALAIDYGTTFTCAAIEVDGHAEVLEIDNSRYLPSVVCLSEDGQLLTGREAASLARVDPERAEPLPKRALVSETVVELGGRGIETVDLTAAVLGRVWSEALRRSGGEQPQRVVLTHPAGWTAEQIGRLLEAARRAGLPGAELVAEPVAAALHHSVLDRSTGGGPVPVGGHVAVYDLGGGTFDTAVLRRTAAGFELRGAPGGDPAFGGRAIDEVLFGIVAGHARAAAPAEWEALWADTSTRGRRMQDLLLRDLLEAKETLSRQTSVIVPVDGTEPGVRVSRAELEAAVDERLRATVEELVRTVEAAGLALPDLHAVLLTGGQSRMPRVAELIAETTGSAPSTAGDPKAVVVLGALEGLDTPADDSAAGPAAAGAAAAAAAAAADPTVRVAAEPDTGAPQPGVQQPWGQQPGGGWTAPPAAQQPWGQPGGPPPGAQPPWGYGPGGPGFTGGPPQGGYPGYRPGGPPYGNGAPPTQVGPVFPGAGMPPNGGGQPTVVGPPAWTGPQAFGGAPVDLPDAAFEAPRKKSNGRLIALVTAGVVVVAAAIGIPFALTSGKATPVGPVGPTTTVAAPTTTIAGPTAAPTTAPTVTAPTALSGNELALYDKLGGAGGVQWATCVPFSTQASGVLAAIECVAEEPDLDRKVVFYQYTDISAYNADHDYFVPMVDRPGECSSGNEAVGGWTSSGVDKGFVACTDTTIDGSTYYKIFWASKTSLIAGNVISADRTTTYNWWYEHAGNVP